MIFFGGVGTRRIFAASAAVAMATVMATFVSVGNANIKSKKLMLISYVNKRTKEKENDSNTRAPASNRVAPAKRLFT